MAKQVGVSHNMALKRRIVNPHSIEVGDARRIPQIGELVVIVDTWLFNDGERDILERLSHIVKICNVFPIVVQLDGTESLWWEYEIYCEEFPDVRIYGWNTIPFERKMIRKMDMDKIIAYSEHIYARRRLQRVKGLPFT